MGGFSVAYTEEDRARMELERQRRVAEENKARRNFAAKIVTAVVDKINYEIIRPGPKPEERECYDVAHEMRATVPQLVDLVSDIIKVKEEEG